MSIINVKSLHIQLQVPIQVKMINPALLTADEVRQYSHTHDTMAASYCLQVQWLNDYHTRCRNEVGPLLLDESKTATYQWLLRETQLMG